MRLPNRALKNGQRKTGPARQDLFEHPGLGRARDEVGEAGQGLASTLQMRTVFSLQPWGAFCGAGKAPGAPFYKSVAWCDLENVSNRVTYRHVLTKTVNSIFPKAIPIARVSPLFKTVSNSKYFQFRRPHSLSPLSTLLWSRESRCKSCINKRPWPCSNKVLFIKTGDWLC